MDESDIIYASKKPEQRPIDSGILRRIQRYRSQILFSPNIGRHIATIFANIPLFWSTYNQYHTNDGRREAVNIIYGLESSNC